MKLSFPKEPNHEKRIAITPEITKKLTSLGFEVCIEEGIGGNTFSDNDFKSAGATLITTPSELFSDSDCVIKIQKPTQDTIKKLKKDTYHISLLDPFNNQNLIKFCQKFFSHMIQQSFST